MPDSVPPPTKATSPPVRPTRIRHPKPANTQPSNTPFDVVGIGASAGGLEACTKLLEALPVPTGAAFILVQHLAPNQKSMLVDLLAEHTALAVVQAADGMTVEHDHLYVIPPGSYLSVSANILRLSPPETRNGLPHGARLPFDALLHSMAGEYGSHAVCVVLSGTGGDGSAGLKALKAAGGRVIVQDPGEAGYDGMPRSAIATGLADEILPIAAISALLARPKRPDAAGTPPDATSAAEPAPAQPSTPAPPDPVTDIIELVRARTRHDFAPYKRGTLERRIERRIGLALPAGGDAARYLDLLRGDAAELDLLAKDLLIHVTSFFRDPKVFATLAKLIISGLLEGRAPDDPVRVWIPGCSTGEEAYSLVILFREAMTAARSGAGQQDIKLQVFASDIDADAVAAAREGLYPRGITTDVSAERLARFFIKEDGHGYRVHPDLRAAVVFTVQDLLTDPPFSRLDVISCRNLMIYLGPDAQAKAVSLFHFALKEGGTLLLGSAEVVGEADGRFKLFDKAARLYRHVGRRRPGDLSFATAADGPTAARGGAVGRASHAAVMPSRQAVLAELCRRSVLDRHAPAAVLCNTRYECLYSLGPTDLYLRVAPGHTTPDLVAMARGTMRTRLRSVLGLATKKAATQNGAAPDTGSVAVPGGRVDRDGHAVSFDIVVQPLSSDGEALLLVCFVDKPAHAPAGRSAATRDTPRVAQLERELEASRAELDAAHQIIEASGEDQRAIDEEALSVNEEFQSTNEELLTSKEELQSLNEELTALNSQLQETLERQRSTSNDLQNILYSTDVATLFLDRELNIRFFTPATRALFNVIPGDVGRPLADLHSLATDTLLPADARTVLHDLQPIEREVETPGGTWFRRRVLPYRTEGNVIEGVVITFNDITRRKQAAAALEEAKGGAEAANLAKSRFLAAASHDLRQPLQTLALLQGLLATSVVGDKAIGLVARLDDTLGAMSGMLDTLLDLNQIEAGIVRPEVDDCAIGLLLDRLRGEFSMLAQGKGLALRVVPCSAIIRTDPRLLEQMLRNLLSNALKYTERGRVLLGCRRRGASLRIEVWDTGIGIPASQLQAVFDEYHQIGNEARERARGLGLGLSIVQRLGNLLAHRVQVRSRPGRGSVFSIEVDRVDDAKLGGHGAGSGQPSGGSGAARSARRTGDILVVEDDPDMRQLLRLLLKDEGYIVEVAPNGLAAVDMVASGTSRPNLILADYNLPGGMSGLQTARRLREALPGVPVIILTGDIATATMQDVAKADCRQLKKPVAPSVLLQLVVKLLTPRIEPVQDTTARSVAPKEAAPAQGSSASVGKPVIFVVDDDHGIRAALRSVLEDGGHVVEDFSGGEAFLAACHPGQEGCLLVDAAMPGMDGLEVLRRLKAAGHKLPVIVITGRGDVAMAVTAMKAGALDFIEKPVSVPDLLAEVVRALGQSHDDVARSAWQGAAVASIAGLTGRQRDVMAMVLAGQPSKNIAADLGISQRTVENHRAAIMHRTGAKSLPALARLVLAATSADGDGPGGPGAANRAALP